MGGASEEESNDFLRAIWKDNLWISAGGYTRDSAIKHADERGELIAFGRYYTSNVRFAPVIFRLLFCAESGLIQPDLPIRLEKNIPLTPYNREVFYMAESPVGYIDYLSADASILAAA